MQVRMAVCCLRGLVNVYLLGRSVTGRDDVRAL